MTTASVVDDRLVLDHVLGRPVPTSLPLMTTYTWWWRLGTALRRMGGGRLSRTAAVLPDDERRLLLELVDRLPRRMEVPDPRELYGLAADLHHRFSLQLLAAEAAAMALMAGAEILVATDVPNLRRACVELGVGYRVA
ncbi:MAG: hypothetical protein ACRDZR_08240 [Acidimicrobiales bacterium]